jgi:hypothetical protein
MIKKKKKKVASADRKVNDPMKIQIYKPNQCKLGQKETP